MVARYEWNAWADNDDDITAERKIHLQYLTRDVNLRVKKADHPALVVQLVSQWKSMLGEVRNANTTMRPSA
ncbi:hypothetical protein K469DRAFT_211010 [Zopfia rhizophila CBS 207.26]|uniref:Uncharacterized protein n=1 Tax=Zopfia rhizophila CBS 207.26 TaxID=1314779 RepID=A0A6A6DUM2_9PEZI|nr:hypothetical protein K469DRAFT_211010 [Zopfia rhizophila CBS 207.26]